MSARDPGVRQEQRDVVAHAVEVGGIHAGQKRLAACEHAVPCLHRRESAGPRQTLMKEQSPLLSLPLTPPTAAGR